MIKIEDVEKAQNQWGSGIVKIGQLKDSFKECRMYSLDFINKMYNFENRFNARVFACSTNH